jgi:hypothetical protein
MTFEEIENLLSTKPPLRLKGLLKKRTEPLPEFFEEFFTRWNDTKPTIYVNNHHVQTDIGKRRSLGDIYLICKYYYPNCRLKDVVKLLYTSTANIEGFRTSYCNQMKKRAFYVDIDQGAEIHNTQHQDEYGNNWNFYKNSVI